MVAARAPAFPPGQKIISRSRRVLAERLGRPLQPKEFAHHKDGNTLNDSASNVVRKWPSQHNREHGLGRVVSPETKEKMRRSNLGQTRSPETKKRIGEASRNRSPEANQKIADAHRGKKLSAEHRQKIGDAHRGKKRSMETRRKMCVAWEARRQRSIKEHLVNIQAAESRVFT